MKRTRLRTGTIRRAISHPVHKVNGHTSYPQQDRSRAHSRGHAARRNRISLVTHMESPLLRKRCTIGDGVLHASMMHAIQSQQESALTGHRFFLLFVFLLATLILFPYTEASHFGSYPFSVIGSVAILVSVYAANVHRSLLIFAIVLAIPALFERAVLPTVNSHSFFIFNIFLTLVFDVVIVVVFSPTGQARNNQQPKPSFEPSPFICRLASLLPLST